MLVQTTRFGPVEVDSTRLLEFPAGLLGFARARRFALLQPDDRAHQHRFAAARTADEPQYLAARHIEIEMIVQDMITKAGCVSGCNISVRTKTGASALRKVTYWLRCGHGFVIQDSGCSMYNGDDVGACNVVTERLKRVKTRHTLRGMSTYDSLLLM